MDPVDVAGLRTPVIMHSLAALIVVTTAATEAVRELLPASLLHPVPILPGRCLFVAGVLHYRDGDLGRYHEAVLALPVATGPAPLAVLHTLRQSLAACFEGLIWRMPVTTERARAAGVQLANFPKTLADVRLDTRGGRLDGTWLDPDGEVLRLCAPAPTRTGFRTLTLSALTQRNGRLLRSDFVLHERRYRDHFRSSAVEMVLGDAKAARALRALDVSPHVLAAHVCEEAHAELQAPRDAGPAELRA